MSTLFSMNEEQDGVMMDDAAYAVGHQRYMEKAHQLGCITMSFKRS